MQAQYGPNPKKMREIVSDMYNKYGWRQGIMRGFWVRIIPILRASAVPEQPA